MSAPPLQRSNPNRTESSTHSGDAGTDAATVNRLLSDCNIPRSQRQVARIVHHYNLACARGARISLYDHLVRTLCMDAEERRRVRANPDYRWVLDHPDPVGEAAVANVMRVRGY